MTLEFVGFVSSRTIVCCLFEYNTNKIFGVSNNVFGFSVNCSNTLLFSKLLHFGLKQTCNNLVVAKANLSLNLSQLIAAKFFFAIFCKSCILFKSYSRFETM